MVRLFATILLTVFTGLTGASSQRTSVVMPSFNTDGDSFSLQADGSAADEPAKIIHEIERAILAEDAKGVAQHFGKQVFLNLQHNEGSYYSSNQALYVLQNFFSTHRIVTFKFTSVNVENSSSYATGGGRVKVKGNRNMIQLYVSLTRTDNRWVISQFNVY